MNEKSTDTAETAVELKAYTYTVFTVNKNGDHSTTHVSAHEARDIEQAKLAAIKETAEDWGEDEDDIAVRGVAAGGVDILEWDDEVGISEAPL